MYVYINDGLELAIPLGDHIEFDHEREMPGDWTFNQLDSIHDLMHELRADWDHNHD